MNDRLNMILHFIFWIVFLPFSLFSVDSSRLAEAFFITGEYAQAQMIYEKMLGDVSENWEEDILLYNIGTCFLAKGEQDKALSQFNAITLKGDENPIFLRSLQFNKSLALLQKAQYTSNDDISTSYNQTFQLLLEALLLSENVEKTDCKIAELLGNPNCESDPKLFILQRKIKQLWNKVEAARNEYQNNFYSPLQNARRLHLQLSQLYDRIALLESEQLNETMLSRYLRMFVNRSNELFAFWVLVSKQINQSTKIKEESKKAFLEASQYFFQTLPLWENKQIAEAKQLLKLSKETLFEFILSISAKSSVEELLQEVILAYAEALTQFPLQEKSIEDIQKLLENIEKLNLNQNQKIVDAKNHLENVLKALTESQQIQARAFLIISYQYIFQLSLSLQSNKQPADVLENGIHQEELILQLSLLNNELKDEVRIFIEEAISNQSDVLKNTLEFIPLVLKEEENKFKGQPKVALQQVCLKKPWDVVIPSFQEGYNDAIKSEKLLRISPVPWDSAIATQKEAIIHWKETLKNLNSSAENKSEQKQPSSAKPKQVDELLMNLQEMLEQDQIHPAGTAPKQQIKVDKPW